jgi:MFS family permease
MLWIAVSYWSFLAQNYRFLAFGLILVFVGNYGQTFFISVFGGVWREAFSLSHTEYSSYYSLATLLSGFGLMWLGGKLDSHSLKSFTLWVLAGVVLATIVIATAQNAYSLFIGFLLIRFCGQGLTGHTAYTTMARYFENNRGKAISLAGMGMPLGELIMPLTAAMAIEYFGWRATWWGLAILLIVVFLPLLLWSLGDPRSQQPKVTSEVSASEAEGVHWQRAQVVRDYRFWWAIVAVLSPAMLITGIFFHQVFWAQSRDWSLESVASSMTLYAFSHAVGSLFTGSLVDRLGARRMLRLYLIPLACGIACLLSDSIWGWAAFMLLAGFSVGASGPTVGALWPEVYGTQYLGSIRALVSSLMVLSTALAPVIIGLWIDANWSVTTIMAMLLAYQMLALLICQWLYRDN